MNDSSPAEMPTTYVDYPREAPLIPWPWWVTFTMVGVKKRSVLVICLWLSLFLLAVSAAASVYVWLLFRSFLGLLLVLGCLWCVAIYKFTLRWLDENKQWDSNGVLTRSKRHPRH
ncbi:MAG: hypothetical protein ACK4XJ_03405 [Fimbriimonadaceae bacterium]